VMVWRIAVLLPVIWPCAARSVKRGLRLRPVCAL